MHSRYMLISLRALVSPDVQRMLRDVSTYTVSTANLQPITVNSYELGWRLNQDDGLNLGLTGFTILRIKLSNSTIVQQRL